MKNLISTLLALAIFAMPLATLAEPSPFLPEVDKRFKKIERILQGEYIWNFAIAGGASGSRLPLQAYYSSPTIPAGSSILRSFVADVTAPTASVGSPAFTFGCGTATFTQAAVPSSQSIFDGLQSGTIASVASGASSYTGTSICTPYVNIGTTSATAGKLELYIQYFTP